MKCVCDARAVLQFTHSKEKANVAAPRQSMKETSKQGVKAKAKFDPKNYTVLVRHTASSETQLTAVDPRTAAHGLSLSVCSLRAEQRQVRQGGEQR